MGNSYSKKDYIKGEVNLVEITQTKDEVNVIKIPHNKATQNKTQNIAMTSFFVLLLKFGKN